MNIEELREHMPLYIIGALPQEQMLAISRALADDPALIAEMQLALMLRQEMEAGLPEAPPLPRAIYAQEERPTLMPAAARRSIQQLQQAVGLTRATLRLVGNWI